MDRGLLMEPDLIRQTIAGNKTETRRLRGLKKEINEGPDRWHIVKQRSDGAWGMEQRLGLAVYDKRWLKCPCGAVGDRLYVKEKLVNRYGIFDGWNGSHAVYDGDEVAVLPPMEWTWQRTYLSPLHMPKAAARIWLKITGIMLERLQSITEEGAKAEGVQRGWYLRDTLDGEERVWTTYLAGLKYVWDRINPVYPWSLNPWVWVVQWKLMK